MGDRVQWLGENSKNEESVGGSGLETWVSEGDLARAGRVRLFCLPHAGSGTAGFHRWKRMLPGWVSVCPVMLPGREARMGEPAPGSVGEVVAGLQAGVGGRLGEMPYAVFGHSMGALLGFAWVRAIKAAGMPGPVRLFCSAREAPGWRGQALADLEEEDLLQALATRYGAEARVVLDDPEMRKIFLPVLRADLRVVDGYRVEAEAEARVRCGVSAFAGVEDRSVSDEGLLAWEGVSGPGFRVRRFPGGHFYSFGVGERELLGALAGELEDGALR